ncbi:hypothetical protein GPA27_20565 [Aromatoleum toluolicum]|uniref:Coil containing protein n=1 Tax=Aromatoleum toluolicum TaxID=90060 RepID=A0ABX1NKT6_9RHOO|nr:MULTISPECIES: hypothetical protein [Rhodocyclales]AKU12602.1 hypothetical protein AzCIB_2709 [Azoarcus sp. CIB]NMF99775.1 hypothetical protein [Aromatoleum toluolicum]
MKTLTINDLPMTEELGREAMSEVRGGMHAMYYTPFYWGGYVDASTTNESFSALQQINQGQSVATNVGNNVAVLAGIASPSVPVTATQNANINNHVHF